MPTLLFSQQAAFVPAAVRPQSRQGEYSWMSLCQAAAWRVKYRDLKSTQKIKVRVENLGVHRNNRGGVFPGGIRCKELCVDVISNGFLKEEFSDKLVAVEEMPTHEARSLDRSRGEVQTGSTGSQYNRETSSKDELLQTCFHEPYGNVQYNLLSHNHMALVILAFITKAKWDLEPIEQKKWKRTIKFCDEQGRLCLTAVAATVNGKELVEVIKEGVDCEVLSWKMELEEPGAAAVISAALNKCSDFAMRCTEWSALYTLRGGIIKASGALGQRVAFKSVLEATHLELDSAADDPDLGQLFDFLISLGVGKNTYFNDLADFQKIFVNSKQRQLRFAAFGVVNKLDAALPRTKIAIIKRAYRKKLPDPKNCWCSNPESAWTAVAAPILRSTEELLLYLHEDDAIRKNIDPENANMDSAPRTLFYGSVDIAVADAVMYTQVQHKNKATQDQVRKAMQKAVSVYMLGINFNKDSPPPAAPEWSDWINANDLLDLTAVAAGTTPAAPTAPGSTQAKVEVLQFEQKTGRQLNEQVDFDQAKTVKASPIEIPWKSWHEQNQTMATRDADKAAVVTMLENIHRRWDVSAVDVKIMSLDGKTSVVAGAHMQARTVMLPPCIPKQCKVYDSHNEHPMAVPVSVVLAQDTGDAVEAQLSDIVAAKQSRSDFLLCPEFKAPTAVAAKPGGNPAEREWIYSKDQAETLHPFWGVRRITDTALQQEKDRVTTQIKATGEKLRVPEFNCEIVTKVSTAVHISVVGVQNVTNTRFITVPYICNFKDVVEGEELILRHVVLAKTKKAPKRDWRDMDKQEVAAANKKAKKSKT